MSIDSSLPDLENVDWLRFLLDEGYLEGQLKDTSDVSKMAVIISTFLQQVYTSLGILKDIKTSQNLDENKLPNLENHKIKCLRILAMKTASLASWNLDFIHKHLPTHHAYALLSSLVEYATTKEPLQLLSSELNIKSLNPVAIFALSLFCCWSLKSIVDESLPSKPSKSPHIQVSGLFNPCVNMPSVRGSTLIKIHEKERHCVTFLENVLISPNVLADMPTIKSFYMQEKVKNKVCDWLHCKQITLSEITCQISYSLGCLFFLRRSYLSALQAFEHCQRALAEVNDPIFMNVSISSIIGYSRACRNVLKVPIGLSPTLPEQVKEAFDNDMKKLSNTLLIDLEEQQLSPGLRLEVQHKTYAEPGERCLQHEVLINNIIRKILDGKLVIHQLVGVCNNETLVPFIKLCHDIYFKVSKSQQIYLKELLVHVYIMSSELLDARTNLNFLKDICSLNELKSSISSSPLPIIHRCSLLFLEPPGEMIAIANHEQRLLTCYDSSKVNEILKNLSGVVGRYNLFPSDRLILTSSLMSALDAIFKENLYLAVLFNILLAKSKLCQQLKMYPQSKNLLQYIDKRLKEKTFHKLERQLKWVMLTSELLGESEAKKVTFRKSTSLVDKAKSCIMSVKLDQDYRPCSESVCLSVVYLLNNEHWDSLNKVFDKNEVVQFGSIVGLSCRELKKPKTSMVHATKLIGSFAQAFSRVAPRCAFTKDCILDLVPLITNSTILSLLISCFVKLLQFSDGNINEDILTMHENLWPSSIANKEYLDGKAILEAMTCAFNQALTVDDKNICWIRTLADLNFALKQYHLSLKYYIYLGTVGTDYFSESTKNIYDDKIYKRMIQSCIHLKCFAQAAVMCQFLSEVDYATSFKCIAERPALDGGDIYYDCIWDSSILEYVIYTNKTNAEIQKLCYSKKLMRSNDMNPNSTPGTSQIRTARKRKFFRKITVQYLGITGL